jgi:ferritin-like metal-binding protein YciE
MVDDRLVRELATTHALELALAQTLTAHIAVTPRGRYRDLLEHHLGETREQARGLRRRLDELGATRNTLRVAVGAAEAVAGQALALGKAPLDLLRGTAGEEKLLRNARDDAAGEALEIAAYDVLEAFAEATGDAETATLARGHRAQEERTLADLRALIPELARDVLSVELRGHSTYDLATTGAADAMRLAVRLVRRPPAPADAPYGDAPETSAPSGAGVGGDGIPIPAYDGLSAREVLPALDALTPGELARVEAYERDHRARKRVLERVAQLRARAREDDELA